MVHILAVAIGAVIGALSRYGLALSLNSIGFIPLGTLICNLLGAYCMGIIVELTKNLMISDLVRAGVIVGFLGSFTTFSTYTAEAMTLLFSKNYLWFLILFMSHNLGSLCFMLVGMYSISWLTGNPLQ